MQDTWDNVFTVPPSRPLHTYAIGLDHEIDEWWDPAIGSYLDWLFHVRTYSHFIVNYTWLSKAFDHAPPGILKILDTHDRFANRRHLLASLGVAPEFFHTTEDQEKIALDRADIVLAIKEQERQEFSRHTSRRVLTLIHAEKPKYIPVPHAAAPAPQRLRVGFLGARNSVNKENFRAFLDKIVPAIRCTMASIEIVLAGGICVEFLTYDSEDLTRLGYVETVDDFYASVDLIVAPIQHSTGLKIKIGEALSYGKPLLALRHAFEGYETTHPLQVVENLDDLVRACIQLSFDPAPLAEMAMLSRISHRRSVLRFDTSIDAIVASRAGGGALLVMADKDVGNYRSASGNRQIDIIRYISHLGPVYIYIAGKLSSVELRAIEDFALPGTKIISAHANSADADTAIVVASLDDVLAELPITSIWVSSASEEDMPALLAYEGTTIIDMDLCSAETLNTLREIRGTQRHYAHSPGAVPWQGFWADIAFDNQMPVPWFMNVQAEIDQSWRARSEGSGIVFLSDGTEDAMMEEIGNDPDFAEIFRNSTVIADREAGSRGDPPNFVSLSALAADLRRLGVRPQACLDLCEGNRRFEFVREIMLRFDVPVLPAATLRNANEPFETEEGGNGELLTTVKGAWAVDAIGLQTRLLFENDAGWCQLWGLISRVKTSLQPLG